MAVYGLIGEKLGHSYSKIIHESLGQYQYELFSLSKSEFADFMSGRQFSGLNITIPYKKEVIPYCDAVTDLAKKIGAVNTIYWQDGKLMGTNTDYQGFLYAASRAGISFMGKHVLILGNGGTSLMARHAATDQGAAEVHIASRRPENGCISYDALSAHPEIEVIVNTTPVGTYPNNGARIIDLSLFPNCTGVVDVIYNPFTTDLLKQAKAREIKHTNGLPMLVAQATAAAEYFLGQNGEEKQHFQAKNETIIAALEHEIENIILIGMPGCGKTTLGKTIAKELGKTFVDMDEKIEKEQGRSIPQIFAQEGESHFRCLEADLAKRLGKEKGQVIATGGGIILNEKNMEHLMQNGRVVFIQRPLEQLATDGRPLSKDLNALKSMYEIRFPLYNKYSQLVFHTAGTAKSSAAALLRLLKQR